MPVYDFSGGFANLNAGINSFTDALEERRAGDVLAKAILGGGGQQPRTLADLSPMQHQPRNNAVPAFAQMAGNQPGQSLAQLAGGDAAGLLRKFEGYIDTPKWDVNAHRVGYGSDTVTDPSTGAVSQVQPGMRVNRQMAEADLARRIPEFQKTIEGQYAAFASLPENVKAGLTSVAYNYGKLPGPVVEALNTGDVNAVASAVDGLAGHNGGVNAQRRAQEAQVIRGGAAPAGNVVAQAPSAGIDKATLAELVRNPKTRAAGLALWQQSQKADLTDDLKEYNLYVKQEIARGRTPEDLTPWMRGNKAAGSQSINVNTGEKSYENAINKGHADRMLEIQKAGRDAGKTANTVRAMESLIGDKNFYSGFGGNLALRANQALSALGVKDAKAATAQETFQALSNQLILDASGGSLGAQISNADREFISATAASLALTPEGNRQLLQMRGKLAEREQQVAKLAREYASRNKGRLDERFDDELARWTETNPLFPQAPKVTPQGGGSQADPLGIR